MGLSRGERAFDGWTPLRKIERCRRARGGDTTGGREESPESEGAKRFALGGQPLPVDGRTVMLAVPPSCSYPLLPVVSFDNDRQSYERDSRTGRPE